MKSFNKSALGASGLLIASLAFAIVGCGSGTQTADSTTTTGSTTATSGTPEKLMGAGSTFVNPAMSKWAFEYNKKFPSVTIDYQSVGSGTGISQYKAGTVDFGASDAPLNDKDLADMPSPTLNIPVVSGAVVLSYNVPGLTADLKLSPDAVSGIFLGTIKNWNDPKITADNPGVTLPSTPITVCHRSDGSGTSFIFTNYLAAISPAWKSGPGIGKTVPWPAGLGGKGNDGVAGLITQTPGSLGYVELAYAVQKKLAFADIKDAVGDFVKPSVESTTAAVIGETEALKKDVRTSIVNSPAKGAYPICGFTYVLVSKGMKDANKAKALVDFLNWTQNDGQTMIADLQYAPLPKDLVDMNKASLDQVVAAAK